MPPETSIGTPANDSTTNYRVLEVINDALECGSLDASQILDGIVLGAADSGIVNDSEHAPLMLAQRAFEQAVGHSGGKEDRFRQVMSANIGRLIGFSKHINPTERGEQ